MIADLTSRGRTKSLYHWAASHRSTHNPSFPANTLPFGRHRVRELSFFQAIVAESARPLEFYCNLKSRKAVDQIALVAPSGQQIEHSLALSRTDE
jgi:hypothetical protein